MVREMSAGGVVVRHEDGVWWMAAIELPPPAPGTAGSAKGGSAKRGRGKPVLALPKGLVDPGETPAETALREVREETGLTAEAIVKLTDIKYVYTRTWAGGERVFKIVSFYLMRYRSGSIDDIAAEMRIEVAQARWVRLEEAGALLAYKGEKDVARRALEYVRAHWDSEVSS
jgi:8-oxo-dGTP pyrophosphatase MutT (NUDIX family)